MSRIPEESVLGRRLEDCTSGATSDEAPEALPGVLHLQWIHVSGKGIQPCHFRYWREHGRLRSRYVKPEDVEEITRRCALTRLIERERRNAVQEAYKAKAEEFMKWIKARRDSNE